MVAVHVIYGGRLYDPAISCLGTRAQVIATLLSLYVCISGFPHLAFEISTLVIQLHTIVVRIVSLAWRNRNFRRSKNQKSASGIIVISLFLMFNK